MSVKQESAVVSTKMKEEIMSNNDVMHKLSDKPGDDNNDVMHKLSDKPADDNNEDEDPDIESSDKIPVTSRYQKWKKNNIVSKLVFVLSVATLSVLALCVMKVHWFIPYYYTISTPILMVLRFIMYWKNKWQYFLIDFCYFANIFCYVLIWAAPHNAEACVVLFAISNGPLAWATVMFRNAMVFHDMDRMTSCYIHILPMFFSFGLRWYPSDMSLYWYREFNNVYTDDLGYMFIWILGIPFASFILHSLLYLLFVYGICKPDEKYLNSLRYLSAKRSSWQAKCLYSCGERYLLLTFTLFNVIYCLSSLLLAVLFYKYFYAHLVYIILILIIVTWNGATFYLDVFAKTASKPK